MSLGRRLASQSTILFAARLGGAGLVFFVQALMARWWGAELLGEFLLVVATVNIVGVAMPLGFHAAGTFFAAEYRARGNRRQLIRFLMWTHGHILGVGLLLALGGPFVLSRLGQEGSVIVRHFPPVVILCFATGMVYINGAVLVGLKRPIAGFFADAIIRPMIVFGAFLTGMVLAVPDEGFSAMLWIMSCLYAGMAAIHLGLLAQAIRGIDDRSAPDTHEVARWWRFALPWALISLVTDFFYDIDLLLLAGVMGREELAIFGICTRIFSLISFGVASVYAVTLPDIFERDARADRDGFRRKVGEANAMASLIALGMFGCVLIFGPIALMIFGPRFTAGALPLSVLCLALVVRSLMGPASMVLSIHDRPYASLPFSAFAIVVLAVGNWLLVPSMGLMGAALSALMAISVWSISLWWLALRMARMDVSILQWFRARYHSRGNR